MRTILLGLLVLLMLSCKTKQTKELTFLSFNVWQEGTSVPNGLNKIRDVVIETNPDIVCFVEVRNYKNEDWTQKIVNALKQAGQNYYRGYIGGDVSFISKYPLKNGKQLFKNGHQGTVVNFEVDVNGHTIVISGVHLDYKHYACYLPRGYNGGYPDWKLINNGNNQPKPITNVDSIQAYNLKSKRDETIQAVVDFAKNELKPIVLMGDFNEPSFLDWTETTKNKFDHNGVVIPWHNTLQMKKAGFTDVFRTFYPNVVTNPGFTWPSFANDKPSTSWTPLADERDRVDYIFYKGENISIKSAALVGPKQSYINGKISELNTENEVFLAHKLAWPSDHKAVFAKLSFSFKN